jgi:hypothetical protein
MQTQFQTPHRADAGLIPAMMPSPQAREALDDLLRPATSLPGPPRFLQGLYISRIDWVAVGAASFIYALAFVVWLQLAK